MLDFSFFCFLSISVSKPSLFLFSLGDVIKRQRPCGKTEFSCANHHCIPAELQCDFFDDCEDGGSDEHDCKACKCTSFCNPSFFTLGFCILWSKIFTFSFCPLCVTDSVDGACRGRSDLCGDDAFCNHTKTPSVCQCKDGFQRNQKTKQCEGREFVQKMSSLQIFGTFVIIH